MGSLTFGLVFTHSSSLAVPCSDSPQAKAREWVENPVLGTDFKKKWELAPCPPRTKSSPFFHHLSFNTALSTLPSARSTKNAVAKERVNRQQRDTNATAAAALSLAPSLLVSQQPTNFRHARRRKQPLYVCVHVNSKQAEKQQRARASERGEANDEW